jgi:hypothetical protein
MSAIGNKLLLWLMSVGRSDPQWLNRRSLGLASVVVTPTLKRWICLEALSRFFAEAYNVQLNTRFQGKWTEYQKDAAESAEMFFMSGVGIVYNPLPMPAMPIVSIQTGTAPAEAIFLQTAWVDSQGNESAPSPINGQVLLAASGLSASMAGGAVNTPSNATGWNLYASTTPMGLSLQNTSPLQVGSNWILPDAGLAAGREPLGGQMPNYYITLSRQIERG